MESDEHHALDENLTTWNCMKSTLSKYQNKLFMQRSSNQAAWFLFQIWTEFGWCYFGQMPLPGKHSINGFDLKSKKRIG